MPEFELPEKPLDESLSQLLSEEEAHAAKVLETQGQLQELNSRILHALVQNDAVRMWDPDDSETDRLLELTTNQLMVMHPELSLEEAKIATYSRYEDEILAVSKIMVAVIERDEAPGIVDPELTAPAKNLLLAELAMDDFDQGWFNAVEQLLSGGTLDDTSSQIDFRTLTVKWNRHEDLEPSHPLNADLKALCTLVVLENPMDPLAAHAASDLYKYILEVRHNPENMPQLEAYIDELLRLGFVTDSLATSILEILS